MWMCACVQERAASLNGMSNQMPTAVPPIAATPVISSVLDMRQLDPSLFANSAVKDVKVEGYVRARDWWLCVCLGGVWKFANNAHVPSSYFAPNGATNPTKAVQ